MFNAITLCFLAPLFTLSLLRADEDNTRAPRIPVNDPPAVNVLDTPVLRDLDVSRDLCIKGSLYVGGDFIASGTVPGGGTGGGGGGGGGDTGSPLIVNATAGNDSYIIFEENGVERGRMGSLTGSNNFFMSVDGGGSSAFLLGVDASVITARDFLGATDVVVTQSIHAKNLVVNAGDGTQVNANPAATRELSTIDLAEFMLCLNDAGNIAYMYGDFNLMRIVDVSDPSNMILLDTVNVGNVLALAFSSGILCVCGGSTFRTLDPITLAEKDSIPLATSPISMAVGPIGSSIYAFVAGDSDGFLYVVDVTDPDNIALVQAYAMPRPSAVVLSGETLFVIDIDSSLLYSIDASGLPGPLVEISTVATVQSPVGLAVEGNIVVVGTFFLGGTIQTINVQNPAAMVALDTFNNIGIAQTLNHILAIMDGAVFVFGFQGVSYFIAVISIADPSSMVQVAELFFPSIYNPQDIAVYNHTIFVAGYPEVSYAFTDAFTSPTLGLSIVGTATIQGDLVVGRDDAVLFVSSSDNRVGIKTASPAAPYALDVAGSCTASVFSVSSDFFLKKNMYEIDHPAEKLAKIRGVTFDWSSAQCAMGRSTGKREIGVIAQEVEAQFPELITYWKQPDLAISYRGVDYDRLNAVILAAVNEHTRELHAAQDNLARLSDLVATYTHRVATAGEGI